MPHERYCVDLGTFDPAESAPLACSGVTTYSAPQKFGSGSRTSRRHHRRRRPGPHGLTVLRAMGAKVRLLSTSMRESESRHGCWRAAAIDGACPDATQQIIKATGGGAACVLDLVGASSTVNLGVASIKKGGEIVLVGLYGGELKLPLVYLPLRGMGIRGSYVGSLPELKELVALAQKGTLKPIKVTRRNLQEASTALSDLKAGKVVGRIVLVP